MSGPGGAGPIVVRPPSGSGSRRVTGRGEILGTKTSVEADPVTLPYGTCQLNYREAGARGLEAAVTVWVLARRPVVIVDEPVRPKVRGPG